jgi:hypothetical protein
VTVIVKCNPPEVSPDGVCVVEERIRYRAQPQSDEAVYVWEAETSGGRGLAMRGHIEHVRIVGNRAELRIRIDPNHAARPLTVDMLRNEGGPGARYFSLARKLQRHAHNKIAPLTADEAHMLQEFF